MGLLIITGIGRCGTSFLTKFFKECGLDVGSDVWFDTFNAGLENADTLRINSALIRGLVKKETVNHYRVWADIFDITCDVVKDPQFLVHPEIIKHWWKVRKDIKIIFLYRNSEEIAESQKKVPEWTCPVYRCFPEMMDKKNDDFLRMVEKLEIPIKKYKYPHMLWQEMAIIEELRPWVKMPINAEVLWRSLNTKPRPTK